MIFLSKNEIIANQMDPWENLKKINGGVIWKVATPLL